MTVYQCLWHVSVSAFRSVHHVGLRAGLRTSCVHHNKGETAELDSAVTYEQLKVMLACGSVQLFDVRNPDEFQAGQIPDSVNLPLGQLEESLKLPPEQFEKLFNVKAPKTEDENIVFQCRSGRRSLTALDIARCLGFSRARHYSGGYIEWAEKEKK